MTSVWLKNNWNKIFALLFLAGIFLQDRLLVLKTFWNGYFVEYQSIAIYPFYFLVIICFATLLIYRLKKKEKINWGPRWFLILSGLFGLLLLVTGIFGLNPLISLAFLIKFLLGLLCFWVILNLNVRFNFWMIALLVLIGLESILGIAQMILQHKLGIHLLIGEPLIKSSNFGIAVVEWAGNRLLRAYGNLPHPNIFGGVMAVGLILVSYFYFRGKEKYYQSKMVLWFFLFFLLIFLGLLFSFSRSAWLALAAAFLLGMFWLCYCRLRYHFISTTLKRKLLLFHFAILGCIAITLTLFSPAIFARFNPPHPYMEKVSKTRLDYFKEGKEIIGHPSVLLKGVGAGNEVKAISEWVDSKQKGFLYQPVHNIFALVLLETGIGGLLILLLGIYFWMRDLFFALKKNWRSSDATRFIAITLALLVLFCANLADHYLWDSMIGFFLVFVLMGMGYLKMAQRR